MRVGVVTFPGTLDDGDAAAVGGTVLMRDVVLPVAAPSLLSRLPLVLIDANQFENALLNLVVNARDAMLGAGRVVVRTLVRGDIIPPGTSGSYGIAVDGKDRVYAAASEMRA